ncbi:MAG: hypothetical protein J0H17_22055 [Rhizobiales bacterium]|nr:hypothetical protein [Hyphomicrobiales bacterium]
MATQRNDDIECTALVERLATAGRAAQRILAGKTDAEKSAALKLAAQSLRAAAPDVLAANARDIAAGEANGLTGALLDRLRLDPARLEAIASAVETVADLPDPVGQIIDRSVPANGLHLARVRIPVGLIGIIYESRPNVTIDAAALCLKSGNATILRGGSEAIESNTALAAGDLEGAKQALYSVNAMTSVLGLDAVKRPEAVQGREHAALEVLVEAQLEARAAARAAKDWAASDAIRDTLAAAGIVVEDGPDGATWSLKRG